MDRRRGMLCDECGGRIEPGRGLIVGSLPMGRGVKVVVSVAARGGTHCGPECAARAARGYIVGMYDTEMQAMRRVG